MGVFKVSNFVGEAPSVSDRALGAGQARHNENLFLPSAEFWPLAQDVQHSPAVVGALSMHRFTRNAAGVVAHDPTRPIQSFPEARSYVKGQVNDEATERTYFTFDDGAAPARVVDVKGSDRLLGVARPAAPVVQARTTDEFTPEEARTWLYGEFVQGVTELLRELLQSRGGDNQAGARYGPDNLGYAGPYSNYGMFTAQQLADAGAAHWDLHVRITAQRVQAIGLNTVTLNGLSRGAQWLLPITCLPLTFRLNQADLVARLQRMEYPAQAGDSAGRAVLTYEQALDLSDALLQAIYLPDRLDGLRAELGAVAKEFAALALDAVWTVPASAPTKPVQPTTIEWVQWGAESGAARSPEWVAYDAALNTYHERLAAFNEGVFEAESKSAEINSRMAYLRSHAASLCAQIEAELLASWEKATSASYVGECIDRLGVLAELSSDLNERLIDNRFYVAALVTDWGEESEPSPVSDMLEVDQNDKVLVKRPALLAGGSYADRHIAKWRLYRSNTSASSAVWQLVQEMPISVAEFEDDKASAELDSLQPQFAWAAPPYRQDGQFDGVVKPAVGEKPYLRGLTGMPNGILAGYIDNTVAFSEPYVPYAWPVEYQVTTEHPIVGMAVFDQTLFVGTMGNPYLVTGSHSASMSAQKLDSNQACMSGRACVSVQGGVLYPSPDGLCLANAAGVTVVTRKLIAREDWVKLEPRSMFAAEHEGVYYLFYSGEGGGCLAFYLMDGIKIGRVDLRGTAVWVDKFNDVMYVADGAHVLACFSSSVRRSGKWRSGSMVLERQMPVAWAKVYGHQSAEQPITVRWIADGALRHTMTFTDLQPQRLPPGRWLEHVVEIEGAARGTTVLLASTSDELRGI